MKRSVITLFLVLSLSGVTAPLVYTKNEVRISRHHRRSGGSAHERNRRREAIRREIAREIIRSRRHHGGHGGGCFIDSTRN